MCFSCGAERNIKKGDKLFAIGEYYDAAEQYRQGYAKIPAKNRSLRGQTASKMAFCYQKINFTQKAISAYNNSMRYNQQLNISQRTNYAQQLLKAGNYKEAIKEFKAILDTLPQNTIAQNGLQSAQQAIKAKEIGSKYIVKRMDVFNSRRSDYCPMFLGNEINRLYFSSTRNEAMGDDTNGITGTKNGDIFVSEKNDKGVWSKPEPVVGGLNTAYDEGDQKLLSLYVRDASYVRLQSIRLSYAFPSELLKRVKISSASVAVEGRNLLVWGKDYDGFIDPETMKNPYAQPIPKSVSLSLTLGF